MNRYVLGFALLACALNGCRSTCCKKPACTTCAPPILGMAHAPPPPVEILQPQSAPAPMQSSPAPMPSPPPPTFPADPSRSSSYVPSTAHVNPSQIANVPTITLEKPEFSETSRREVTTMKTVANRLEFREITPGKLATGPKPSLDDLDRLARAGYVHVVAANDSISDGDRRVFANRGLTVEPSTFVPKASDAVYVYASDAQQLRAWWVRYFKEVDLNSEEAAGLRADRLLR